MDIKSLKIDLIHWLTKLNDKKILEEINHIKESHQDWWDEISQKEKEAIDDGISQLDRGESVSHEEVKKRIRQKFNL